MKGQYEQQCNAAALKDMGVPVINTLKMKHEDKIRKWIESDKIINVNYPDNTEWILNKLLDEHLHQKVNEALQPGKRVYKIKHFRQVMLKKIAAHL